MSMGLWFWPTPEDEFQPLLTAGYTMSESFELEVVHQLAFSMPSGHDHLGMVSYRDTENNLFLDSEVALVPDQWHFAMLTITPEGNVTVYVDGVYTMHWGTTMVDFHTPYSMTGDALVTDKVGVHVVGTVVSHKAGASGKFFIGSYMADHMEVVPYNGRASEVRVYSRALTAEEVDAKMWAPLDVEDEVGLEGYYKLNDGVFHGWQHDHKPYPVYGDDSTTGARYAAYCCGVDEPSPKYPYLDQTQTLAESSFDEPYLFAIGEGWQGSLQAVGPDHFPAQAYAAGGFTVQDSSPNQRHAQFDASQFGMVRYVYSPSPTSATCPQTIVTNVVHVDGGSCVEILGSGFAKSEFLKCQLGDHEVLPGIWNGDNNITCCLNHMDSACALSLEVANNGRDYSSHNIPMHFLEMGLEFGPKYYNGNGSVSEDGIITSGEFSNTDSARTQGEYHDYVEADNVMDDFNTEQAGYSVGLWFYPYGTDTEDVGRVNWNSDQRNDHSASDGTHDYLLWTVKLDSPCYDPPPAPSPPTSWARACCCA